MISAELDSYPALVTECFIYQLLPGCGPAYDKYHQVVWPEVQEDLRLLGYVDYAIYRRGDLVISVTTRHITAAPRHRTPSEQRRLDEWAARLKPLFAATMDENGEPLFAERKFQL